jgi:hypothetical protein
MSIIGEGVSMSFIRDGEFGELVISTEQVEITSMLPRPDHLWRHTDRQGHEHYWTDDGYPTLRRVDDETYWCGDCDDEHTDSHWECAQCGERVEPGMSGPSGFREFIPGPTSYTLNGEPISKERAEQIIQRRRA